MSHELGQGLAHLRLPGDPPQATAVRERAAIDRAGDQLPHVEGVALAVLADPAQRSSAPPVPPVPLRRARRRPRRSVRSSSRRSAPASFHSDTIASGSGSPTRSVAITNALPVLARCSTSAAETGSSSWASSTPSTTGPPAGAFEQGLDAAAHQLEHVVGAHVVREQPGQRPERNCCRAAGRLDPVDDRALDARRPRTPRVPAATCRCPPPR